tara:strand:+ start:426 stop:1559 length:1134 start_codon:yes stop_codon:yes gene_type:complete
MPQFDQIANALMGFGAGVQGRGPEFIQGLAYEKKTLSDNRKRAAAIDMYEAYNLLESGNIDGAMKLGEKRHNAIVKLGGDPSDTVEFMRQLSEDPSGQTAKRDLENGLKMASAQKHIDLPDLFSKQKPTSMMQNVGQIATPGTPEYKQLMLEQLNRPGTTVNVGGKEQVKASEEMGKLHVKRIADAIAAGEAAEETLASVRQLQGIDVSQGGSVPLRAALADAFASVGIDTQALFDVDLANVQAFNSVNKRLVNQVLNQAKGPQTEGDAQRAGRTLAKLGNKPEANAFILDTLVANGLRKVEQKNFLEGAIDNGLTAKQANADWNKFKNSTPMLSTVSKVSKNGIPVYFFQFKEQAKANRPDVSDEEIIAAWRTANK